MCDRAGGGAGEGQGGQAAPAGGEAGTSSSSSRPGSGTSSCSRLEQRRESNASQHKREGSGGSGDGLLLSVSALAGTRGRSSDQSGRDNCDTLVMGQTVSVEEERDLEDDEDGVVDIGQLNKLKAELKAAHAQLEVKEEQVVKLSKIRDEVEAELEELTASLFQV